MNNPKEKKEKKQIDCYHIMIISRYFEYSTDYLNIIQVNKKYKNLLELFRYNPIPIETMKLFPNIQTHYLYNPNEQQFDSVELKAICYEISYSEYREYISKEPNMKCFKIVYTSEDRKIFGNDIPEGIYKLDDDCFRDSDICEIVIPDSVREIGCNCFFHCSKLSSIQLSTNITSLPFMCFGLCLNLKQIVLPDSIISMKGSFFNCNSLSAIGLSKNLVYIGESSFKNCVSLRQITFPDTLKCIDENAFNCCILLSQIVLPHSVRRLGDNAFSKCSFLTSIELSSNLAQIGRGCFVGCNNLQKIVIPSSVCLMEAGVFVNCKKLKQFEAACDKSGDLLYEFTQQESKIIKSIYESENKQIKFYNINFVDETKSKINIIDQPEALIDYSCGIIARESFKNNQRIESVHIPPNVIHCDYSCFENCQQLTSVTIPSSLTALCDSSFEGCVNLKEIDIPICSFEYLHTRVFKDCISLQHFIIPTTIHTICDECFEGCNGLLELSIPSSVTKIGNRCFMNCNQITSISISSTIQLIGIENFLGCDNLQNLEIPLNENNSYKFAVSYHEYCLLKRLQIHCKNVVLTKYDMEMISEIPTDVPLKLDAELFRGSENEIIEIPDNVISVGNFCFAECNNITRLSFPSSVTKISKFALFNLTSLKEVELPSTIVKIGNCMIENCNQLTKFVYGENNVYSFPISMITKMQLQKCGIQCPEVCFTPIDAHLLEKSFMHGIPLTCSSFCHYGYHYALKNCIVPTTITKIRSNSFLNCFSLESIVLPSTIKRIGNSVFANCYNLKEVIFPPSLEQIKKKMCYCNFSLTRIDLPSSLTKLCKYAFHSCSSLKSLTIPSSVQIIGKACFNRCTSVTSVTFDQPYSLKHLSFSCFYKCFSIQSLELPTTLTQIDSFSFFKCENITSLRIPSSVKHLRHVSFKRCFSLKEVFIEDGLEDIGKGCFASCTSLERIHLPNSITRIEGGCLLHCKSLTSLTLSSNLHSLHIACIDGCTSLKEIFIDNQRIKDYTFDISYNQSLILNSIGINTSRVIYTSHDIPQDQTNITIPHGVIAIEDNCFRNNTSISEITVSDTVQYIGKYAFKSTILKYKPLIPETCQIHPTAFENMTIRKSRQPNSSDYIDNTNSSSSSQCIVN